MMVHLRSVSGFHPVMYHSFLMCYLKDRDTGLWLVTPPFYDSWHLWVYRVRLPCEGDHPGNWIGQSPLIARMSFDFRSCLHGATLWHHAHSQIHSWLKNPFHWKNRENAMGATAPAPICGDFPFNIRSPFFFFDLETISRYRRIGVNS